ncbi:protein F-related protein [Vibrio maritimus]|uniref:Protein F-related protein n=1 Tax=Vibrio maritimus TaxID=990268 RepID=A0A090TLU1_9VIBR|nr:protein F-related protein [Vibrio maritimus]
MLKLKKIVAVAVTGAAAIILSGCSSISEATSNMFPPMLETAPRDDSDVMHADWAKAPIMSSAYVGGPNGQYRTQSWDQLETYLVNQGLDYELIPGDYVMIRLKQKIHFNTGSANVADGSAQWLSQLASFLSNQNGVDVVIDGHTDNTGTVKLNDSLSDKRAESVKRTLVRNQVPQKMIYTRGYGEYVPACTNSTQFGKAATAE